MMTHTPFFIRPGQDPNLATLIQLLPSEIDCPFTYGTLDKRTLGLSNFLSSFPMAWQRDYCRQALYRVDPVVAHGIESVAPFSWREAWQRRRVHGQDAYDDLIRECALEDGYTFVVHDPHQRMGLLSLFNRERNPDFHADVRRVEAPCSWRWWPSTAR